MRWWQYVINAVVLLVAFVALSPFILYWKITNREAYRG